MTTTTDDRPLLSSSGICRACGGTVRNPEGRRLGDRLTETHRATCPGVFRGSKGRG